MSSSSFIRLKHSGVAEAPDGLDGYTAVFPWAQGALDALAARLGVTPPADFVYGDLAAYEELTDGELPQAFRDRLVAQREWHDAADGVRTFAALLDHLGDHRDESHRLIGVHNDFESVRLTVDVMERVLERAAARGDSFRIEHEL